MSFFKFSFLPFLLLVASGQSLVANFAFAQDVSCSGQQECQDLLTQIEAQIQQNEATIAEYQKQGKTLTKEINALNAQINKYTLQIRAVNLQLSKLDTEIDYTKKDIKNTEGKLDTNKSALANLVRGLYENDRAGLFQILLKSPRLSDFFNDANNLISAQQALADTVSQITDLRNQLVEKKDQLSQKRNDAAALKAYQDAQRAAASKVKQQKNQILTDTKGQESKYQSILKQNQKTAAQIRSRIFELLGGGELTFDVAYKFAKFAEQSTGVRAAFTLAILDKESALGQNVGKCNYRQAMNPTRDIPIFLALTSALAINPDAITVSCANRDGAYGGAMGPAQFIPSTWNLYADRTSQFTGHSPASPWNNGDAFIATALYLKDASSGCNAIYSRQADIERCGAAKYYAGARWRTYLWGYGDRVATKAQQFQNDIDVLNS